MRKPLLTLLFIVTLFTQHTLAQPSPVFSRVRVQASPAQINQLLQQGISFDESSTLIPNGFVGEFSQQDIVLMRQMKLKVTVMIDDITKDFVERNKAEANKAQQMLARYSVPPGFNYGSMGGYLTFAEMERELDSLRMMYPHLITAKVNLGNSLESRPIWMVKISDNPEVDEDEPEVFLNGLIHAREPMSMMNLIYFMQYVLANYTTDPELQCLINSREIYVVPCINPDGYVYNQQTHPNGGGTWRKNRRNNGDGTFGVDINRNFGFNWGYDNTGSSPLGSSDSYRGTGPFSEPETRVIRDFCISRNFGKTVNHHSYANTFNTPWGYINQATPDHPHYLNWGKLATQENTLKVGTSYQNLGYVLNGGANDWMYGEQTVKNKIFAAVVETGTSSDGFWPVQSSILRLNESNLRLNINTCWAAGDYVRPEIPANTTGGGSSFNLPVQLINYGLLPNQAGTVSFVTADSRVMSTGAPVTVPVLQQDQVLNIQIPLTFTAGAAPGTISGTLQLNTGSCSLNFPVSFNYTGNCSPLPSNWSTADVGAVGIMGSVCVLPPDYQVTGSGTGLAGSADQYRFAGQTYSGNFTLVARVKSVNNTSANAQAAILITETLTTGSRRVSIGFNPADSRIYFQSRTKTGARISTTNTARANMPLWLKITRNGSTLTAYYSTNGTNWTLYKSASISMNNTVYAGLAVTSGINTANTSALFDNVSITAGIQARTILPTEYRNENSVATMRIHPNPITGNKITVQFMVPAAQRATLLLRDMYGRLLLQQEINMPAGSHALDIPLHVTKGNGVYFMQVINAQLQLQERFVIAR